MSVGVGFGSFMDGFSRGAGLGLTIKNQNEAREERARQRKLEDEDRKVAAEDRDRRRQREDYAFSRQLEADSREDRMRKVHADAVAETEKMARGLPQGVMQAGPAAGGATAGGKALPAMAPSAEAVQATDRPGDFLNLYVKYGVPKIVKAYLEQGDVASAQAYQSWIETEGVKKGMKSWAKATHAAASGDDEGWFRHTIETYNTTGYFDDGYTAIREKSKLLRDDEGNIIGAQIAFKGPDGKEFLRKFDGIDDLYRASVQFMSPENVFQYGLEQVKNADKLRADAALKQEERAYEEGKAEKQHQRELEKQANASQLRLAEIAAKLPDADAEYQEAVAKERTARLRDEGGAGPYTDLSLDDQIAAAEEAVQKLGLVKRAGAQAPGVPAQRRVGPPGGRVPE